MQDEYKPRTKGKDRGWKDEGCTLETSAVETLSDSRLTSATHLIKSITING